MSSAAAGGADDFAALDHLATLAVVTDPQGRCVFVNAAFEQVLGLSRKAMLRNSLYDWLADPRRLRETTQAVSSGEVSTSRFDAMLRGASPVHSVSLPVHVIVSGVEGGHLVLVEMIEIEQQTRLDREERALGQVQQSKELIRNLAHEIKNPLGGIRGAAQLLQMEVDSRELTEYTQVIIHEADRLQALVDRLLAPHRKPHVVGDVNIHEVCERVRALILAEFPRGLAVVRDYDTSLPEFRGDREQLIQAVLNIAHNAAQALAGGMGAGDGPPGGRMAAGDARITMRTRAVRQVTIGKQRYRLALELLIRDNGPGIPESIRDRVFYPLVSGREGGSGLGLTLAQTFVQQHQGTIDCDSAPGRTDFRILIPLP